MSSPQQQPPQGPVMLDAGTAQVLVSLGELKSAVSVLDERVKNMQGDGIDHETRLRALEATSVRGEAVDLARRRAVSAIWAAAGSAAAAIATGITVWQHGHLGAPARVQQRRGSQTRLSDHHRYPGWTPGRAGARLGPQTEIAGRLRHRTVMTPARARRPARTACAPPVRRLR